MIHELKIWPEYFEAVKSGKKTFEIRKNDRNFKEGDILVLKEFVPTEGEYTGRSIEVVVTYVLPIDLFTVIMGIVPTTNSPEEKGFLAGTKYALKGIAKCETCRNKICIKWYCQVRDMLT